MKKWVALTDIIITKLYTYTECLKKWRDRFKLLLYMKTVNACMNLHMLTCVCTTHTQRGLYIDSLLTCCNLSTKTWHGGYQLLRNIHCQLRRQLHIPLQKEKKITAIIIKGQCILGGELDEWEVEKLKSHAIV